MQLTELEYQLLEFISKNEPVKKSTVLANFKNESEAEFCISRLTLPTPNIYHFNPYNTRYLHIIHENAISNNLKKDYKLKLTDLGLSALKNYKFNLRKLKKQHQSDRLWKLIPILIALLSLIISLISLIKSHSI